MPQRSTTLAIAASTDAGLRTSQPMAYAWPPAADDLGGDLVRLCLEIVSLIVGEIADRHGTAESSEFESDLPADAA